MARKSIGLVRTILLKLPQDERDAVVEMERVMKDTTTGVVRAAIRHMACALGDQTERLEELSSKWMKE